MYLDLVRVTGGTKVKAAFPWIFCKIWLHIRHHCLPHTFFVTMLIISIKKSHMIVEKNGYSPTAAQPAQHSDGGTGRTDAI